MQTNPLTRLYLPIAIILYKIPFSFQNMMLCLLVTINTLGLILDNKLMSSKHIDDKIEKANTGIAIIRCLYNYLPRNALLQVYKSFIRPRLYSERAPTDPMKINAQFTDKFESVQYNSALAITGCVCGT